VAGNTSTEKTLNVKYHAPTVEATTGNQGAFTNTALPPGERNPLSFFSEVTEDGRIISSYSTTTISLQPTFRFTKNLWFGQKSEDVKRLQEFLNQDPETRLALFGFGSLDKETNFFGALTRFSVIRFQEKYYQEVLAPLKLKKGTGFFGEYSRIKANKMMGD
jgi:hypothetical protein